MKTTFRRLMLPFLSLHHDSRSLKYGCMNTFPKKEPNFKSQIQSCFYLSPHQLDLICGYTLLCIYRYFMYLYPKTHLFQTILSNTHLNT